MSILEDLWYGNIEPMDTIVDGNKHYKELLSQMTHSRDTLNQELTKGQQETLEKYDDHIHEMYDISEKEAFACGFRLGMRLTVEALTDRRWEE